MNPHKKETSFFHYLDEAEVHRKVWYNTELWVEAGGLALIIGTLSLSTFRDANVRIRLLDENNEPLFPYRTPTNTRNAAHFTAEPSTLSSRKNLAHITFHMIVNCKCVNIQICPDDGSGVVLINKVPGLPPPDYPWSHKPISTLTAIPLLPHYQGGANTVFTYPKPPMPKKDKTPQSKDP